jgi:hypothetical protein
MREKERERRRRRRRRKNGNIVEKMCLTLYHTSKAKICK